MTVFDKIKEYMYPSSAPKDVQINNASTAQSILSDPLAQEALNKMRGNLHKEIVQSNPNDREKRENNYFMLKAIDEFENCLQGYIDNGKFINKDAKR